MTVTLLRIYTNSNPQANTPEQALRRRQHAVPTEPPVGGRPPLPIRIEEDQPPHKRRGRNHPIDPAGPTGTCISVCAAEDEFVVEYVEMQAETKREDY